MIVGEIKNITDIKAVLCHPVIYDTITCDGCPSSEEFEPPINDSHRYVAGYVNDEIIGLLVYHTHADGEECHVQVLPRHRKEHAKKFAEESLKFRNREKPLYAKVPSNYPNVLKFAQAFGFEIYSQVESSDTKNGKPFTDFNLKYRG